MLLLLLILFCLIGQFPKVTAQVRSGLVKVNFLQIVEAGLSYR